MWIPFAKLLADRRSAQGGGVGAVTVSGKRGYGMTGKALLGRMARAVVDKVAPEQVMLFGSWARGDATTKSDFNFIVVETVPYPATTTKKR